MPRRTASQTRQLLLRSAVELLRERAGQSGDDAVAAALAHVRFTQVAERATALVRAETRDPKAPAVTTGAIYNLWPNQVDFQVELLLHVAELQATFVPGLADGAPRFRAAAEASVPLEEVVGGLVEEVYRHSRADPLFRIELAFLVGACDPRVERALRRRHDVFAAGADVAWQGMLDAYGLRPRPPYTIRDLTTVVAAQIIGATVLSATDPEGLADPAGEAGWSLASRAVATIVRALTELA